MHLAFPLGLLAALLAIPLVLLYVLKLRRRDVVVASTLLWRRVVHDRRANAPWERLRRHLLLLLQLVALLLLVLAFAGPFKRAETILSGDTVIVLDVSASMGAQESDGRTRFDLARRLVADALLSVEGGRRAALVVAGPEPRVAAPLTSDRLALERALRATSVTEAPSNLASALDLATALARGSVGGEIVLVTDGAFDRTPSLERTLSRCRVLRAGGERPLPNAGLVSLALRPLAAEAGVHELFVSLAARGDAASREVVVEAARPTVTARDAAADPEAWTWSVVARERAVVDAGQDVARLMRVQAEPGVVLRVSSAASTPDGLAADDRAFIVVPPPPTRRVLLCSSHPFLLGRALAAQPGVDVSVTDACPGSAPEFDAVVIDGPLPSVLPDKPLLAFGAPALPPDGTAPTRIERPRILRWDARHPALRHARFDAVQVDSAYAGALPPGATVLVESDRAPLAVTWPAPGGRALAFRFDLVATDLPLRVAFPVLIADALDWLTEKGDQAAVATGWATELSSPSASRATLVEPDGTTRELEVRAGSVRLPPLERAGIHALWSGGGASASSRLFATALLSPEESDLSARGIQGIAQHAETTATARALPGRRYLWPWAVALVLGVLMAEWTVHHRRRE